MAEKKYLDYNGLQDVAGHVNTRLKTVTSMPVSADNGAVRLYVGVTTNTYTQGHIYQYSTTSSAWVDITDNSLDDLNNVDITSPTNGQVLTYNSTTGEWENADPSGGGSSDIVMIEQSNIQLDTGQSTTVTFTNNAIDATKAIDIYVDRYGVDTSSITVSSHTCTVVFPPQSTAITITVRLYINLKDANPIVLTQNNVTLSTLQSISVTFTDDGIKTDSAVTVYTNTYGINTSNISVTQNGQCSVLFPIQQQSRTIDVRLYVNN